MVYAANLRGCIQEPQNANLVHLHGFVDWLDEKSIEPDSNLFIIDAKAGLEAADCRLGVHVESKWVILGVLWNIA